MYSSNSESVPAVQAGYAPYFYQAGLYLRYAGPWKNMPKPTGDYSRSVYDFSSDWPVGSRYERIQTVEDVIARGYFAVPGGDPVTAILSDRKHTSRLGLDDAIRQIRTRYEIYSQNMTDLDQSICEANNALFRQMADHGQLVANQRQQYSASKQIQKVYEQKREERVNLWRDVSRVRALLPESAQQYLSAYRKVSALESFRGDEP